ncbi:MAG: aromatic ring-hydroxylating dioxygenase subunit alpha [Steroidobacteraceae bacterium]
MNARPSSNSPPPRAAADVLQRLRSREPATALDRDFYTHPEDFQLDLEMIWYREWLFVGHDCEVPKAGNYLTVQVGEYPVVIVRDREGALAAFHNSCRHRGSRICPEEHGSAARLVCPYHQWTYSLDGRLLAARDMGAGFDKSLYGLKRVHCESVGGYVWICLAPSAPDFDVVRAHLAPYFVPHRLHETKVAYEYTIIENANWKLVWENNRECYHCPANHPELLRSFPEDPTITGVDGGFSNPRVAANWARWEGIGLPSVFKLSADGQFRTARYPLIEGKTCYTMDGQAAVRRPLTDSLTEPDVGSLLMFHFPTTWNHVMADHATTFRMLPLTPTTTQLTTKWLVHKDAVEGVDYDLKRLTEVWVATNASDRRVCQENQIGINSPAYDPAPYSPVHEAGVKQFVDWYCTRLEERLTENAI